MPDDGINWITRAKENYSDLTKWSALRTKELSELLQPYIEATDQYGIVICQITLILGKNPPKTAQDVALRDLMADVFDFLYETRPLILKGKLEIAYPLARRAYESLSLMVACYLDKKLAERWISGKRIDNGEIRKCLSKHPGGEPEKMTQELYQFFSRLSHPNREMMANRFLGEGNEFVLGAIGVPSLAMLADYALKTLDLWFWFGAFVTFVYLPTLYEADAIFFKSGYDAAVKMAREVSPRLVEQFNRTLVQEQNHMDRNQPVPPTGKR
jgi:hypothetical protein